ncbi:MAG TPA: D-alanyl-D-alanine carboxypeptidase/D-alanyl-D-alanine-endopeptidase [Allosphingosinicella sp.]|jgi:D-alanyl-D-alanine carboxypeptidase/D-alanyl-D-alanine-endopeptidase (penicillin-binding protein 4)
MSALSLARPILPLLLALCAPVAAAQAPLQQRVEAQLAQAGSGTRFGLVVAAEDGREIVAINPDGRFIPASNTKIFTTAAAMHLLGGVDAPDTAGGASVRLEGAGKQDVVLAGHGDARLSSAADCVTDCLAGLADAVAARTKRVGNIVADDSFFPDQRWSPGMSWNNIPTRSGTAASALTLDDSEYVVRITAAQPGQAPRVEHPGYFTIENRATTVREGQAELGVDRLPGSTLLRLTGAVLAGAAPETLRLGIDDPAQFAAWRFKQMLEARGVRVSGAVQVRHRPNGQQRAPAGTAEPLARLTPPPLLDDVKIINKVSQNLHAELLLRRVALQKGNGSLSDGLAAVEAMVVEAGVPADRVDLSDGSGMSTYNRVTPRGMVTFLRWVQRQPWGAKWRDTLPIGGLDGTLARRFKGTPLEGRVFAKTGSLNATTGLSGYLIAKSGRTLTFSAFANDIPEGVAATKAIDTALLAIASEH